MRLPDMRSETAACIEVEASNVAKWWSEYQLRDTGG